ncbi:MAG: acyl-CoA thioesterase [Thermoanaerobaculia bacterium]
MSARVPAPPLRGFSVEIPVRFAECDSYGVVWHGHYALYLECVREALTARFGFTATTALGLGYRVPVTRMEVRYRLPIRADTTIRAIARLRPPEVALFVIDYELRDDGGQLLASALTEQVVLNAQGELLVTLPGDLKKMAGEILRFQDRPETLPL